MLHLISTCSVFIFVQIIGLAFPEPFTLTVLHINDVHSRFLQTNQFSGRCSEVDEASHKCYGGLARIHAKANEIRKTHTNVAFLSAGDFFQGTMWYTIYKWRVVAHFVNQLKLTAMAIGNHEFDDGVDGLVPFLDAATFPIISSNINAELEPAVLWKFQRSVVVEYEGRKVGIIGYTGKETQYMSNTGELIFEDEVAGVKKEAKRLDKAGVKILIALGHAGFDRDIKIARIPFIDLVVGGHTNTFLYSGKVHPDAEKPVAKYPAIVKQSNGRIVPVVQAFAYGKYLGYLNVTFDDEGEITSWDGNPILLNGSIPEDPDMKKELNEWGKNISATSRTPVGKTRVFLDGRSIRCQMRECNLGNVIADAMIYAHFNQSTGTANDKGWSHVTMAILNSGRIHGSIDESSGNGIITMDDIFTILPFQNTIDVIEIQGKYLWEAFEFSMKGYDRRGIHTSGKFLQVSGIRVSFIIGRPVGQRVVKIEALCRKCRVPTYLPLNLTEIYKVALPSSLANGGDGYKVIRKNIIDRQRSGIVDADMMFQYFRERSPIIQGLEGRITFLNGDENNCPRRKHRRPNKKVKDNTGGLFPHGPGRLHLGTIRI